MIIISNIVQAREKEERAPRAAKVRAKVARAPRAIKARAKEEKVPKVPKVMPTMYMTMTITHIITVLRGKSKTHEPRRCLCQKTWLFSYVFVVER
jgi:hypothetical protein